MSKLPVPSLVAALCAVSLPSARLAALAPLLAAAVGCTAPLDLPVAQDPTPRGLQGRSPLQVVETDDGERDLRLTPVVRAVQRAADSVVSIYIQHQQALARGGPVTEGQGSGVVIDAGGLVITNWHVIAPVVLDDGYSVQVRCKDGRTRDAKVLSSSPAHDLALLQVALQQGEQLQPVLVGRSADLMVGETVIAIGNPQGHANTVTSGVLSATGRSIKVNAPDRRVREYTDLLQTDAAINQGNSGGALLDITGKLIGINNAMAVGAENIGFAIPVDKVREVFERELTNSSSFAASVWLGMEIGENDGKLVVTEVTDGGPAAVAGVQRGDVLANVAGQPVRSALDYAKNLVTADPTRPFALRLLRNGRPVDAAPTPRSRALGRILTATGMMLDEITQNQDPDLLRRLTLAFYRGTNLRRVMLPVALRISNVQQGSPASALRLQPGDVLLAVVVPGQFGGERDERIPSAEALADYLGKVRAVKLVVLRGEEDLVGVLDVRQPAAR